MGIVSNFTPPAKMMASIVFLKCTLSKPIQRQCSRYPRYYLRTFAWHVPLRLGEQRLVLRAYAMTQLSKAHRQQYDAWGGTIY